MFRDIKHVDFDVDWALVECEVSPPVAYHRIAALRGDRVERLTEWATFGFPRSSPDLGKALHGTVTICNRGDGRTPDLLELFCYEAAAGEAIAGCSGGPVFIGREIVGIVRAVKEDRDLQALLATTLRVNAADIAVRAVGGTLYSTPIGQPLEWITTPHPGFTPPALDLDFSWFTPVLRAADLPPSPFKGLSPYTEQDRAIYFGRENAKRDLLKLLFGDTTPALILLHGSAGAGKSSLLAAGVLPYLRARYEVLIKRHREHGDLPDDGTLVASLDSALDRAAATSRPVVLIIDQVENVFADGHERGFAQLSRFMTTLRAHLDRAHPSNLRTVVLVYREEFHAKVSTIVTGFPNAVRALQPMSSDEVGVALEQIQQLLVTTYRATVEDGLIDVIAKHVTSQAGTHAPLLQMLMTRMWDEATPLAEGVVARHLTHDLFRTAFSRFTLADFLGRQLEPKRRGVPEDAPLVEHFASGLALSLLRFHTTRTASVRRGFEEVAEQFGRAPYIPVLVEELRELGLLVVDQVGTSRLAHDALSPIATDEFDRSAKPGPRATRRLDARSQDVRDGDAVFSQADRAVIAAGLPSMRRLAPPEIDALFASALKDGEDDVGFWYRTALEYKPAEAIQQMLENKVSSGVAQAIIENAELRERSQLRTVAFRYAIEAKDGEGRRRLANEIADHLWTLTATEQRELEAAARDERSTSAIELAGRIAVRACALPVTEKTARRKVTRNAGEQLCEDLASGKRDQWCMWHGAIVAALALTPAFWFLVPVWMSTLRAKLGVQIIGDFIPPFVWIVGIVLVIPTWALRRQIHGLAVAVYPLAWRGFHLRFFVTTVVLIALLIGFAKAGGQVLQETIVHGLELQLDGFHLLQPVGYTLAHGLQDFVLSMGLAAPCALAIWASLPLVTRVVGETPPIEQLTLVDRLRRYGAAILLACGLPLITSSLLVLGIAHAMSSPCDLRIDDAAVAGIWVALVVGTGSIVAMTSVGVHQASERVMDRRELARANAVPPVRSRPWVIMLAVALAIAGLSLTYVTRDWIADRFDRRVSSSCFISEPIWSLLE